jgi:hypothetical protein
MQNDDDRRCSACGELSITKARGYKRNWTLTCIATLAASIAVAFLVTRL